jgi:hypothetical protein
MLVDRGTTGMWLIGSSATAHNPAFPFAVAELRNWRLHRTWAAYESSLSRASGASLAQVAAIARGELRITLAETGEALMETRNSGDELFVPGPILIEALGRLPFKSLILHTDSIPWPTPRLGAAPLVLLLEPAFDAPKHEEGEAEAMRCWNIHIVGSGESSRWYLNKQGRVETITFAGGAHLHPVDISEKAEEPRE